jgi:hypothetical protein
LITEYLDGKLASASGEELRQHVEQCQKCRYEFESLSDVVRLAADTRSFPIPSGFSNRLYKKVEELRFGKAHTHSSLQAKEEVPIGITDQLVPMGSHLIHFWQNQADFERGVRFLYPGLGKDEHCIIFGHVEALERVQDVMRESGYDPEQLVSSGKLTILNRHAAADTTVAEISAAMEAAFAKGARMVRFLGNLGMGSAPLPAGEDDVLQLEAKADALIRDLPAIIVCMYDLSTLPGRLLFHGGLQTHDLTVCHDSVQSNPFYRHADDGPLQ